MKDWMKSDNLPEGWKYRDPRKGSSVSVRSPDGTIFESFKSLTSHFLASEIFSEADLENLAKFQYSFKR